MSAKRNVVGLFLTLALTVRAPLGADASKLDPGRLTEAYAAQRIVGLDIGEKVTYALRSGASRNIRLVSVQEHRDRVIHLVRRADVRIEIDGRPVDLACAPYVMPTEAAGLRVLADTTSGWGNLSKRVQLSIWDASGPLVDTSRFGFPIRDFRLFSQGTQAYNEPVHLGAGDGDPDGQRFYHDYGFDNAGFEGREEILSATDGKVVRFWPSRDDLSSVLIEDPYGFVWEYGHLCALAPGIELNTKVRRGQAIGVLGKTGPSGNFSHLHLGTYLSLDDADHDRANRRMNLFPWLVEAYRALHPDEMLALARPHHEILTGEKVVLDGSHSLAFGGRRIVHWRWILPDGRTVDAPRAEAVFEKPGAFVAELRVQDDRGAEDVDFCQIKVFSRGAPEKALPHIFMTSAPTRNIHPGQPVSFRFWFQGAGDIPLSVDFGDGVRLDGYTSYSEVSHDFPTAGLWVVTARGGKGGLPLSQKLKVVVDNAAETQTCDMPRATRPVGPRGASSAGR